MTEESAKVREALTENLSLQADAGNRHMKGKRKRPTKALRHASKDAIKKAEKTIYKTRAQAKRAYKETRRERRRKLGLMLFFTLMVFIAMTITVVAAALLTYLLMRLGLSGAEVDNMTYDGGWVLYLFLISIPIGVIMSWVISKIPFKPVQDLVHGMNRLAAGDFTARVYPGRIMKNVPAMTEVSDSFNKMAQELEGTEMLRSDFINNFSHEFKTPIVSIAGFAKLLNRGNLTPEQQREYLKVIEEESLRLSYMATNVLNMTKVENQAILTDESCFNLSEQLRSCILLLEEKWSRKELELELLFDEHEICANEELLKQVWINLLDNAIKFTPQGGFVKVMIRELLIQDEIFYNISVANSGSEILQEHRDKIFHKFYQADESHASEGNGVGLAVVKKIVQLHDGAVEVHSENKMVTFVVTLPRGI